MSLKIPTCKITVLKRGVNQDLIDEYVDDVSTSIGPCDRFAEGQEFLIESPDALSTIPEGFCAWAWADIRKDILIVAFGGNMPGMKQHGTIVTGCSDPFRPVIFKVERMENG